MKLGGVFVEHLGKLALRCEKEPIILDLRPTLEAAVSDSRRAVFLSPVIGFVGWAIPRLLLDLYRLLAALLSTLRTAWFPRK